MVFKDLRPCALDESSLSIGRVNSETTIIGREYRLIALKLGCILSHWRSVTSVEMHDLFKNQYLYIEMSELWN